MPVDTTLLFRQSVNIANRGDAISRTAPSALGITDAVGYKSIGIGASSLHPCIAATDLGYLAQQFVYFTETIAKMDTHAAAQAPLPLWFFMLQFDADNSLRGAARDCNAPWAFWCRRSTPQPFRRASDSTRCRVPSMSRGIARSHGPPGLRSLVVSPSLSRASTHEDRCACASWVLCYLYTPMSECAPRF